MHSKKAEYDGRPQGSPLRPTPPPPLRGPPGIETPTRVSFQGEAESRIIRVCQHYLYVEWLSCYACNQAAADSKTHRHSQPYESSLGTGSKRLVHWASPDISPNCSFLRTRSWDSVCSPCRAGHATWINLGSLFLPGIIAVTRLFTLVNKKVRRYVLKDFGMIVSKLSGKRSRAYSRDDPLRSSCSQLPFALENR